MHCQQQVQDTTSLQIFLFEHIVPKSDWQRGSVLGPLLFLTFISDIHLSLNTAIIKLFPDDTNFFVSGGNFDHLKQLVIAEVRSFQTWIQANKLTINYDPQKSGYSVFKPKNRILPYSYNHGLVIGENKLCYRECTKYLGLFLEDQLTWKHHITETNKKIIKNAGMSQYIIQLLFLFKAKLRY